MLFAHQSCHLNQIKAMILNLRYFLFIGNQNRYDILNNSVESVFLNRFVLNLPDLVKWFSPRRTTSSDSVSYIGW